MNAENTIKDIVTRARDAVTVLANMDTETKNSLLIRMADALDANSGRIKEANLKDLMNAEKKGISGAFLDRLRLNDKRLSSLSGMFRDVASLEDPVGKVIESRSLYNQLLLKKVRVPIGVIGIIYESRPNVTADCVSLCLKSGNVVILRGGSDAVRSNKAIYEVMKEAVCASGISDDIFILIEDTDRSLVEEMLKASYGIDLIMPRGGESLIRRVMGTSRIPVIKHYKGICHVYVDEDADINMAIPICVNAKTQRPGVCNAMETMLVHSRIAEAFLPKAAEALRNEGVAIKGCAVTRKILGVDVPEATDEDFATEWLDLVLNVKVVDSVEEAVGHIARFGSHHSDAIVTSSRKAAEYFTTNVDSAAVYVNASTRFTDGGEFGMGAEIGISTDKIHARGPMGLEELTTYKYVIEGKGQVRE